MIGASFSPVAALERGVGAAANFWGSCGPLDKSGNTGAPRQRPTKRDMPLNSLLFLVYFLIKSANLLGVEKKISKLKLTHFCGRKKVDPKGKKILFTIRHAIFSTESE